MQKPFIEEDYEALYKSGFRPDPYGMHGVIPVGQLEDMCSIIERNEREKSGRLHRYECVPNTKKYDKNLVIKEFKRSCVGAQSISIHELRPWSVIQKTLRHLLLDICLRTDEEWMYVCDFVFDRLKALRQDMVIQRIEGRRYIELLEGSIRFSILSMYKLTCEIRDFSHTLLEPKQVIPNEGLVKGLSNYEMSIIAEMKLTMKCLRDCLNSLIVQYQENVPNSPHRALFEAVNLIVNLPILHGHNFTATEFLSNKRLRDSDPTFKVVFRMFRYHLAGFHLSALKYLPMLFDSPLLVLAYAPVMAQIQIDLVTLYRKLYASPSSNRASLTQLANLLCPDFLESNADERLLFAQLMAVQFEFFDINTGNCNFYKNFGLPEHEFDRGCMEIEKEYLRKEGAPDSETRIYALQMIAGKKWSFYQDLLSIHGLEAILDPSQPPLLDL